MKAVNAVTKYLLGKMMGVETRDASILLADIYDNAKKAAVDNGVPEADVEEAARSTANLAVAMNIAVNLKELLVAAATAGRVICEVADPEMVASAGGELHTPEQLRAKAKEAGGKIAMLLQTLQELLPAVQEDIDVEHVAERLVAHGQKVKADRAAAPTAKKLGGTVVPFGKRIEPSSN